MYFNFTRIFIICSQLAIHQIFIIKMSIPRLLAGSPVRKLDERYNLRSLDVILEENNALRLSNAFQNQILEQQKQHLVREYTKTKELQVYQFVEATKLKKEKDILEQNLRTLEARSIAQNQAKEKQLQGQQRDIQFLREEYKRQNQTLKDQLIILNGKLRAVQTARIEDIENIRKKYQDTSNEQTDLIKRNLGDQLHKLIAELEVSKAYLGQKQRQLQHIFSISQQNSQDYTNNLQRLISENNVLRNQLLAVELQKNKEIQVAQTKKELQKSRTVGILSYCKENSQYMEKELTRLVQQLLEKNLSIQSFTKELLKHRRQSEINQKKFEEALAKLKHQQYEELAYRDSLIEKNSQIHKLEITDLIRRKAEVDERLSSKQDELENVIRELIYDKKQLQLKQKEIDQLKDSISRMHEDHSNEISKVMNESRVKRKSKMNISSYSSSSLKQIEQAQGSSILKSKNIERKSSYSNEGSGHLPIVKQQLAVSEGNIDDDDDEDFRELVLHYEGQLQELRRTRADQFDISRREIDDLRRRLQQIEQEKIELLNRFSPLMELKVNRPNIQEQRRAKLQQNLKPDLSILSVLLDKYQIVSLKPKK